MPLAFRKVLPLLAFRIYLSEGEAETWGERDIHNRGGLSNRRWPGHSSQNGVSTGYECGRTSASKVLGAVSTDTPSAAVSVSHTTASPCSRQWA